MKQQEILDELEKGICELTYTDENSIEIAINCTICPVHLYDDELKKSGHEGSIMVWDVVDELWVSILVNEVIEVERLTGEGAANNQRKLKPHDDYLEQLLLNAEDFGTNNNENFGDDIHVF